MIAWHLESTNSFENANSRFTINWPIELLKFAISLHLL